MVAKTLPSLVLQEKHLKMLHIHRPEDYQLEYKISFPPNSKYWPPLGSLVPDVVIDERCCPCAVAVAFLPVCAIPATGKWHRTAVMWMIEWKWIEKWVKMWNRWVVKEKCRILPLLDPRLSCEGLTSIAQTTFFHTGERHGNVIFIFTQSLSMNKFTFGSCSRCSVGHCSELTLLVCSPRQTCEWQ